VAPGEEHHQFTGERGGLWRHRGRGPHALLGIGFVAEGWDGHNRPYKRSAASFIPEAAWAFEGIGSDELIGEGGLVMGGAAGDELDVLWNRANLSGTKDTRIRADITLTPKRNGGAVFGVGSISWTGALSHNEYNNPVAQLCANVLCAFTSGATPWLVLADAARDGVEAEVSGDVVELPPADCQG
jgi:N,N-dimethylformamidase